MTNSYTVVLGLSVAGFVIPWMSFHELIRFWALFIACSAVLDLDWVTHSSYIEYRAPIFR